MKLKVTHYAAKTVSYTSWNNAEGIGVALIMSFIFGGIAIYSFINEFGALFVFTAVATALCLFVVVFDVYLILSSKKHSKPEPSGDKD